MFSKRWLFLGFFKVWVYLSTSESRSELFWVVSVGRLYYRADFLKSTILCPWGIVFALVCCISLLCGKWTVNVPYFYREIHALICLRDSHLPDKINSPWKVSTETSSLILPQKEAMILKFGGIHLGALPTWIFPLFEWLQPQALSKNLKSMLFH